MIALPDALARQHAATKAGTLALALRVHRRRAAMPEDDGLDLAAAADPGLPAGDAAGGLAPARGARRGARGSRATLAADAARRRRRLAGAVLPTLKPRAAGRAACRLPRVRVRYLRPGCPATLPLAAALVSGRPPSVVACRCLPPHDARASRRPAPGGRA
ncbi:MAG: hypothetical protein MZW92_81060 [Comamonadaceae bacterium]|nr:hypothetical protein [Comamonadaceae bacterium]